MQKLFIQRFDIRFSPWISIWLAILCVSISVLAAALLPLSTGYASVRATALQQNSQPVYGLLGKLGKAENYVVENYLLTSDNKIYLVVGETPVIEAQIVTLRDQRATVKVWGLLYPQGRLTATPEVVVSNILAAPITTTISPLQPAATNPQVIVRNATINVRSGPDTAYAVVGSLQQGQRCPIIGRNGDNSWWQIQCLTSIKGWVFGQLVDTTGNTSPVAVITIASPPPTPPLPTPLPPTTFYGWKMSFWNNRDLAGVPDHITDVPEIAFDWGGGPTERPDLFSTRFERTINFNPGSYRFVARSDDGVRVFIDNQPIIDEWHTAAGNVDYTVDRAMYGNQTVRVEHYEANGLANLHFSFQPLVTPINAGGSGEWEANYYNNPDLAGNPLLVRREPSASYPLDLDWGNGSPAPGVINDDNWSTRWRGRFFFEAGDFTFKARSDDGVRVYIDSILVLDAWQDGYKETTNQFNTIGRGEHEITVEYYERGGSANNRVWWYRTGTTGDSGSSNGSMDGRDQ